MQAKRALERACDSELGITHGRLGSRFRGQRHRLNAADELLRVCDTSKNSLDVEAVAQQRGLVQVRDEGQLDAWVDEAVKAQPQAATDFAAGKDAAAGRLVGHVMKISKGQADAATIQNKLRQKLRGS
jgi:aspartyl-tRNA(Asn)/glutamyl-tRNA(Gln) amidotransferase subunit B